MATVLTTAASQHSGVIPLKEGVRQTNDPSAVLSVSGSIGVNHATLTHNISRPISNLIKMIYSDGSEHHAFQKNSEMKVSPVVLDATSALGRSTGAQDVKEDHFVLVPDGPELRSLDRSLVSIPSLAANRSSRMSSSQSCCVRFVTASSPSFATGVLASNFAYTPTSATDFSTFAALYSEYRIDACSLEVRPVFYTNSTDGPILNALMGDDPGAAVTTPTATNVRLLDKAVHLKQGGTVTVISGQPQRAVAAVAQPTNGGWLQTGQSWPGQFCLYLNITNASASSAAAAIHRVWRVSFRNRFA